MTELFLSITDLFSNQLAVLAIGGSILILALLIMVARTYKKSIQGQVIVRSGFGGVKVSGNGIFVFPVIHRMELMDISVKSIEISRMGKDGLICRDNMRADIKVTFFVKVNPDAEKVKEVAESIGCKRASHPDTLIALFDAKFSDVLKTVGKTLDFVELYEKRDEFRASQIMQDRVLNHEKIEVVWNSTVEKIVGDGAVSSIILKNIVDDSESELNLDGVFVAIGHDPNVEFLNNFVELDEKGYIKTGFTTDTSTSVPGVFAAGDVADSIYRQAITAAGTGCQAAIDSERWLDH